MYICIYKDTAFADVLLVQGVGFALGSQSSSGRIQAPLSLAQPPYEIRVFLRSLRWMDWWWAWRATLDYTTLTTLCRMSHSGHSFYKNRICTSLWSDYRGLPLLNRIRIHFQMMITSNFQIPKYEPIGLSLGLSLLNRIP